MAAEDLPTTAPGELVGRDRSGRVRISREVPLQWALTVLGAVVVQAATLWFQLQTATEAIKDMRVELRAMSVWQSQSLVKDAEVAAELRELRRRLEQLEGRKP